MTYNDLNLTELFHPDNIPDDIYDPEFYIDHEINGWVDLTGCSADGIGFDPNESEKSQLNGNHNDHGNCFPVQETPKEFTECQYDQNTLDESLKESGEDKNFEESIRLQESAVPPAHGFRDENLSSSNCQIYSESYSFLMCRFANLLKDDKEFNKYLKEKLFYNGKKISMNHKIIIFNFVLNKLKEQDDQCSIKRLSRKDTRKLERLDMRLKQIFPYIYTFVQPGQCPEFLQLLASLWVNEAK